MRKPTTVAAGWLSKAGVFETFFDHLASLSSAAHLVQMFDSTVIRAHVSAAAKNVWPAPVASDNWRMV
ncbi:hypothetical protein ABGN05_09380 [Aquibium sp. LZ166]|uniref:Transposase n=1 Tax=Aquibium pacificus TaxID=3153579 RepID=A0ABV3SGI4_9HYPH